MIFPRAVLLDLDDTSLDDSGGVVACWRDACHAHQSRMNGLDPEAVFEAIDRLREWYWSDPERHRVGRLELAWARGDVHTAWTHVMGGGDVQLSMSAVKPHQQEHQPCIIHPVAEMPAFIGLVRRRLFDIGSVDGRTCRHAPERCSPRELPVAIAAST